MWDDRTGQRAARYSSGSRHAVKAWLFTNIGAAAGARAQQGEERSLHPPTHPPSFVRLGLLVLIFQLDSPCYTTECLSVRVQIVDAVFITDVFLAYDHRLQQKKLTIPVHKRIDNAHSDSIWAVAWAKNRLLSGSLDETLKSWCAYFFARARASIICFSHTRTLFSFMKGLFSFSGLFHRKVGDFSLECTYEGHQWGITSMTVDPAGNCAILFTE